MNNNPIKGVCGMRMMIDGDMYISERQQVLGTCKGCSVRYERKDRCEHLKKMTLCYDKELIWVLNEGAE